MADGTVAALTHIEPELFLDQAYCLVSIMEGAFRDAAMCARNSSVRIDGDCPLDTVLTDINRSVVAEAMAGIKTLLALSAHAEELMRHARSPLRSRS
jgi:hypothetical protein